MVATKQFFIQVRAVSCRAGVLLSLFTDDHISHHQLAYCALYRSRSRVGYIARLGVLQNWHHSGRYRQMHRYGHHLGVYRKVRHLTP